MKNQVLHEFCHVFRKLHNHTNDHRLTSNKKPAIHIILIGFTGSEQIFVPAHFHSRSSQTGSQNIQPPHYQLSSSSKCFKKECLQGLVFMLVMEAEFVSEKVCLSKLALVQGSLCYFSCIFQLYEETLDFIYSLPFLELLFWSGSTAKTQLSQVTSTDFPCFSPSWLQSSQTLMRNSTHEEKKFRLCIKCVTIAMWQK